MDEKPKKKSLYKNSNAIALIALGAAMLLWAFYGASIVGVRVKELTNEVNGLEDDSARLEARLKRLEGEVDVLLRHPGDPTHLECDYYGRCRIRR